MNTQAKLSPPVFPYPWASAWGEDEYGLWQALNYQGVRLVFRWIIPGSFAMGSPETESGRFTNETLHQVTLSQGFWLAETPVTQALWQAVMQDKPSGFKGEQQPVENVSWRDVQRFIEQLASKLPQFTCRLPWEAEWEYACRAGSQTAFNFGDDINLSLANYRGTWQYKPDEWGEGAIKQTSAVKSYVANAWGLYDMHGNVWEWCQDVSQEDLGNLSLTDPWLISEDAEAARVLRGGSWFCNGMELRSAVRNSSNSPVNRSNDLGFRLALGHVETG